MSLEERIDLLGKVLANNDDDTTGDLTTGPTWEKITLEYTNGTNYKLRLFVIQSGSGICKDYNARSHDFKWALKSNLILNPDAEEPIQDELIVGYAGGNNVQYDHRTHDVISSKRYIELEIGQKIKIETTIERYNDDDSGSGAEEWTRHFINSKIVVCGTLE